MEVSKMSRLEEAHQLFGQFKQSLTSGKLQEADATLTKLKGCMMWMLSLPPRFNIKNNPDRITELTLARYIWENALLLAVHMKDDAAFERAFLQLRSYYTDARPLLKKSEAEDRLVGVNLLRLLVQNRIAEFHTELELLTPDVQSSQYVQLSIQLEQWLMEGAYNKVLESRSNAPDQLYAYFMEKLLTTIRDEIASCSERGYESLSVPEAKKLLLCASDDDLTDFAEERGWTVENGTVTFNKQEEEESPNVSALHVINNSLTYARELERIV